MGTVNKIEAFLGNFKLLQKIYTLSVKQEKSDFHIKGNNHFRMWKYGRCLIFNRLSRLRQFKKSFSAVAMLSLIRPYSWRRKGAQFCRLLHVVLLKIIQHLN